MIERIIFIAAPLIVGATLGIILTKMFPIKDSKQRRNRSIHTDKTEFRTLQFEKGLAEAAIAKVYESRNKGKISSTEQDRLVLKYKKQIEEYNEKIANLKPEIEFIELTDIRNDIVSLLEQRINALDKKLAEHSQKYGITESSAPDTTKRIQRKEEPVKENLKAQTNLKNKEERHALAVAMSAQGKSQSILQDTDQINLSKEERDIHKLQKEIMDAMTRLEQIETRD